MVQAKTGKKISRGRPTPKFCILFWTRPGSGQNFNFSFKTGQARAKIFIFTSGQAKIAALWAGPDPCRPLGWIYKPTSKNVIKVKNQTYDHLIVTQIHYYLRYLRMITYQAHSTYIVDILFHSACSRFEKWQRKHGTFIRIKSDTTSRLNL